MAIATWGDKVFEVNSNRIYTINDISFSAGLETESQEVEGGKPATYIKGKKLIPLAFSVKLDARYVDVKAEIDYWTWRAQQGTPQTFTLGGQVLSQYPFLLKEASISDENLGPNGVYISAKVGLTFEEFVKAGAKKADSASSTSTVVTKKSTTVSTTAKKTTTSNPSLTDEAAARLMTAHYYGED